MFLSFKKILRQHNRILIRRYFFFLNKDYQNKLIYLVPEKQLLNERIKNMQLGNTPGKSLRFVIPLLFSECTSHTLLLVKIALFSYT